MKERLTLALSWWAFLHAAVMASGLIVLALGSEVGVLGEVVRDA